MGIMDFLLGRRSASNEDVDAEIERQNKAYGDLYSGGEGRVNHAENDARNTDPRTERRVERLENDLRDVERRAKGLHLPGDVLDKNLNKIERRIGGVEESTSARQIQQRQSKLRHGVEKSYERIQEEHAKRLEKLASHGAPESRIRREERKLENIRKDLGQMYRDAGGRGGLRK